MIKKGMSCVRICVRKTFQNLLELEKIRKSMENHIERFQLLIII
jgi:hypothetical protein